MTRSGGANYAGRFRWMPRIHNEYVVHDDQNWVFRTQFALTDSESRAANALETKKSEG